MFEFIRRYFENRRRKIEEANAVCEELMDQIETATADYEKLFSNPGKYLDPQTIARWNDQGLDLIERTTVPNLAALRKCLMKAEAVDMATTYSQMASNSNNRLNHQNEKYIAFQLPYIKKLICPLEGRDLDKQQLACIIKDAKSHLVVAGAGTGKTTTVIGKIKYLLKTRKYSREEILVLSFTNASAAEMRMRIKKETGQDIDAMTFHKLGITIIAAVDGIKPNITTIVLEKFVNKSLERLIQDPNYLNKLIKYIFLNNANAKSDFDFSTEMEYDTYLQTNPPITLRQESVKSNGEIEIANYLYKNGINYSYEHPYIIDTATDEYARYLPDFFLPDESIYIEFFALNRLQEVPCYFSARNNKSPSQTYKDGIDWKRQIHAENETTMVELYYYDVQDGQLLQRLEQKLKEKNVIFNPMSDVELWEDIKKNNQGVTESFVQLFATIINLIKINNYSLEDAYALNSGLKGSEYQINLSVLQLIEPIFTDYNTVLKERKEIDFNDMINQASEYVSTGRYAPPYQYVIVDEYQDISRSRYNLLKQMRDQRDYQLFCVGDDWQSIYQFAGSDIDFILDFDKYWGCSERSKIETTYRFSKSLIEISSQFIMTNPSQLTKSLHSSNTNSAFSLGVIEGYTQTNAVDFMIEKINDLPVNSSIYFIGRYNYDVKMLDNSPLISRYDTVTRSVVFKYPKRSDLKIEFVTAHKSKGLQADYVFILNNKGNNHGFPSKKQNHSLVSLLIGCGDSYEYSEERRLFYVAMTRTKKKIWLLVTKEGKSEFASEILAAYGNEINIERYTCPKCGGRIVKKKGPYGDFLGCSNYRINGCKYTKVIKSKQSATTI